MKKQIILVAIIISGMLLLFSACSNEQVEDTTMREALLHSGFYSMQFHNNTGNLLLISAELERRGYTHFIFVHSEEEFLEGNFPDDAFVAWPSFFTHLLLKEINFWISEDDERIELEMYSLTYPLTMNDLIYDWRNVRELWVDIESLGNTNLWWYAFREHDRVILSELDILSKAFELAGIDVTKYGFELPFYIGNFSRLNDMQNILSLYERLDEEVQLQISPDISTLMALYRNEQRTVKWQARRLAEQEAYDNAE